MKKRILLILALVAVLAGCRSGSAEAPNHGGPAAPEPGDGAAGPVSTATFVPGTTGKEILDDLNKDEDTLNYLSDQAEKLKKANSGNPESARKLVGDIAPDLLPDPPKKKR